MHNLRGVSCLDRKSWAGSGGRLTLKFLRLGGTGEGSAALVTSRICWKMWAWPLPPAEVPRGGAILAIFVAVLIKIRVVEFFSFIFCYWTIKVHFTLPMKSPSKNLKIYIMYSCT